MSYQTSIKKEKEVNRAYLRKVLENIIFIVRQRLPMRGNWVHTEDSEGGGSEQHSNFHHLLLRAKDDPSIIDIMQRKTRKYTHIQNELLQVLALDNFAQNC